MGASGSTTINFGAFPGALDATVTIIGQAGIIASSLVEAWVMPLDTADHSADEHMVEQLEVYANAQSIIPGTGFDIRGFLKQDIFMREPMLRREEFHALTHPKIWGLWTVGWVWC